VGEYHFCHERQQRLALLKAGNGEAADLRTAQAVAVAQLREAEVQITSAQHDLAEILLLVPGTPLPLPADQPLVGPYRTRFSELFAGRNAPQHAQALDQTLPLRSRAVENHAAALLAAEDALDAAIELQAGGQGRLASVIAALDAQIRQQRAFLAAVCRYNHDIADYALAVVSPQTTPELLVGTLIKQNRPAGQPVRPLPTTATRPAAYQEPIATPVGSGAGVPPASGSIPNRPTPAVRPGGAAGQTPPAVLPIRAEDSAPIPATSLAPPNSPRGTGHDEIRLAPPQESAIPLVPDKPAGSLPPAKDAKSADGPTTRSTQKPIGERGPPQSSALEVHPGLQAMTPAERTAKLTLALFHDPNLPSVGRAQAPSTGGRSVDLPTASEGRPPPEGRPVRLIDCIRPVPMSSRAKAIESYWNARQMAAEYQSLVEQVQWLEALRPTLSVQDPPSPTAMLSFRTVRMAVEADRADAEADCTAAKFQLADIAGLETKISLPRPVSVPFVGRLPLGASRAPSWTQRRLEATIPRREQAISDQAAVVVEADAARAASTADFLAGQSSVERVLAGIEVQARETSAFLRAVTEYNRALSQYAIATLPANTEAEKLVAALMTE
jgi:hypothetical protein